MNKYLTEMIGTFFLVLTVGCIVLVSGSPLAIGAVLMVMVFAGGHISGAHYNPAVTLAVWIRGRCGITDVAGYWVAQLVGAVLAAFTVKILLAEKQVVPMTVDAGRAFLAEFLFTFALAFVVLNVATAKGTAGNSFYGLAIGMTVLSGAFAVGHISGGVFNPAVAVGITVLGLSHYLGIWVYLVANFLGGAVAALAFKVVNPGDN